jgi:hypothetical protein
VERQRKNISASNTVIPSCRQNQQVDHDLDYDWGHWNLAAKRRNLMELPSGSASIPNNLVAAPYYVEHQQTMTSSAATLIALWPSFNQSTVADELRQVAE